MKLARFGTSTLAAATSLACYLAGAGFEDFIDVKLTPAVKEHCHVVRFPQGWKMQGADQNGQKLMVTYRASDYEFRVLGTLSTWFLVGAFTPQVASRPDATNRYRVNLSDPTASALPATDEDWNAATVLPLVRKYLPIRPRKEDDPVVFNGFRFTKSGDRWASPGSISRLSPDSAWLVLSSVTDAGTTRFGLLSSYKVFLDVFSADTGEKVLTIAGTYSGLGFDPFGCLAKTAWLTERYFILPLGEHRDRCLVCEFGARSRGQRSKP